MFRVAKQSEPDIALCSLDASHLSAKIGRDPKTCVIKLDVKAAGVSREHAELKWSTEGITVVDNSSYGTFIDGSKLLKSSRLLKGGETVRIGVEVYVVRKVETSSVETGGEGKKAKPSGKITSFFSKNSILPSDSRSVKDESIRFLAKETPSDSVPCSSQSVSISRPIPRRQPAVSRARRTANPLIPIDDNDDILDDGPPQPKILALESINEDSDDDFIRPSPPSRMKREILEDTSSMMNTQVVDNSSRVTSSAAGKKKSMFFSGGKSTTKNTGRQCPSPLTISNQSTVVPSSKSPTEAAPLTRRNICSTRSEEKVVEEITLDEDEPMEWGDGMAVIEDDDEITVMGENPPKRRKVEEEGNGGRSAARLISGISSRPSSRLSDKSVQSTKGKNTVEEEPESFADTNREALRKINTQDIDHLASLLCSSHSISKNDENDDVKGDEEADDNIHEVKLDPKTQEQLVAFSDSMVRPPSQWEEASQVSVGSLVRSTSGKRVKKFTKARQGRFYSQRTAAVGTIGGSDDLVDFRQIRV